MHKSEALSRTLFRVDDNKTGQSTFVWAGMEEANELRVPGVTVYGRGKSPRIPHPSELTHETTHEQRMEAVKQNQDRVFRGLR